MSRIARKDFKTPFLHVMVQGINKEYIFYKKEYIEKYLEIIKNNIKGYDFAIIAYCIMNNHAHFLVYVKEIENFGKFMQKVNLIYSKMYNKNENRCGVLFRNRYKSEPIYDKQYLINCIKYIHENPVKAKMVKDIDKYEYSSYKDYINNTGLARSAIMNKIFGEKCDYNVILKNKYEKRFIDIEESTYEVNNYIRSGIQEYIDVNSIKAVDIFSNRECLKRLIKFLNINCSIKYVEIRNYFEIPRGIMDALKI